VPDSLPQRAYRNSPNQPDRIQGIHEDRQAAEVLLGAASPAPRRPTAAP